MRQVCEGGLKVPGQFQSTHSLRSATMGYTAKWAFGLVSIHALLAECDSTYLFITSKHLRVSIHALLAECDHQIRIERAGKHCFNPRTPCGVRQVERFNHAHVSVVSIHALLAECDLNEAVIKYFVDGFNPRTPCGVRQTSSSRSTTIVLFQSTHSLRSATFRRRQIVAVDKVSIHALLAECDAGSPAP